MNASVSHASLAPTVRPHLVPGATYLAGYSGGADSTALLHVLHQLAQAIPARIIAVHLNHLLRGPASDADEQACAAFCDALGIPFVSARIDVAAYARKHHLSLEDAARRCRFRCFCDIARQQQASAIFLAHHADDQAETVLLRLLRGAGLRGLGGIRPVSHFRSLSIIRPFLHLPQSILHDYAAQHNLPIRHDHSNTDQRFDRNWLRHDILPRLAARFPALLARITATATIARDADDYLMTRADELFRHFGMRSFLGLLFPLQTFAALHPALQRALLYHMLAALAGEDPPPASFERIECLRLFASSTTHRMPEPLPRPFTAEKAYGHLLLSHSHAALPTQPLSLHGRTPLDAHMTLAIEPVAQRGEPHSHNGEAWRDAVCGRPARMTQFASLPPHAQLAVRPRRPGDRYTPLHGHTHTIKDLFIAARIPAALKDRIPIVVCGERIVWLPGWRIAAGFAAIPPAPVHQLSLLVASH